jgi:sRNA-binding regulator protein Hfq
MSKTTGIWGRKAPQFYENLRDKRVLVHTVTGKSFSGQLIGVDVYDIVIRQESGLEIIFAKGNIVFVHGK